MYIVFVECLFYGYYHTWHLDLGFVFLRLDFSCSWFTLSITHQFVQLCLPMSSCNRPRNSGNDIFQLEWILLTFYIWNWVIKYKDVYKVCLLIYLFPTGFINIKKLGYFHSISSHIQNPNPSVSLGSNCKLWLSYSGSFWMQKQSHTSLIHQIWKIL